jgi:hypothetical protein
MKYFSLILCGMSLLSGCGGGSPSVTLSATNLTFGSEVVGATSPAQTVTLSNSGTGTLSIVSIIASADFGETHTCGSTLAPGANCTISVTFTPSASGSLNGTVSVTDNAAGSPQSVSLSGTGVAGRCTPIGSECGPGLPHCCAAPFPHHSFCSNPTGFGTCIES